MYSPEIMIRIGIVIRKLQIFYLQRNPGISQIDLDDAVLNDLECYVQEVIGKPYPPAEAIA
jgi:hypothetical protein